MKAQTRGRPRANEPKLSRDQILDAALALLAETGLGALTMRALARRLGIDPMAAYHYFADKSALLSAAAERSFASLRPRMPADGDWRSRLRALSRAYLRTLRRSRELLLYVVEAGRVSAPFDEHFFAAIAPLGLSARDQRTCRDALVDLLHGVSLAGVGHDPNPQISLLFLGMEALSRGAEPRHRSVSKRARCSR
ncbi:MAG: TetR/AcrR family transcriptional regulator [Labilithrix sp.]|nr:TetR/AcrR family transcriptional regulator [Labilithrix sp.]